MSKVLRLFVVVSPRKKFGSSEETLKIPCNRESCFQVS
jgi:hypothetical protein